MKKIIALIFTISLSLLLPKEVLAQEAPPTVSGVLVEYPECQGDSCSFVQASCSWDSVDSATSYTYTITEEDTDTEIQSETVDASTTRVVFPVTQGNTYRCDVFATNSSGQSGGTGSHSLLCEAEGLVETPTPTTASATATPTPLPTKPPIDDPGGFETTAVIIGGVMLLMVGGAVLMFM